MPCAGIVLLQLLCISLWHFDAGSFLLIFQHFIGKRFLFESHIGDSNRLQCTFNKSNNCNLDVFLEVYTAPALLSKAYF